MKGQHYDAASAEMKWARKWEEWAIYRWDERRPREETFVIDSPPPTVSGSLHIGHVFSYTHQDLLARFMRMRGMNVCYPMGWDDNGLPTERRVQNYFNVRCNPNLPYQPGLRVLNERRTDPLPVSRPNFIELCQAVTAEDEKAFKELFSRLGLSVDWSLEYATISEHCRRLSQLSFIRLFETGEIYQDTSPAMWDVDFQTAVAQAEVEDREVGSAYHRLRFKVVGGGDFLVATTRPELLPACVAVMVHPDDERYKGLVGRAAVTPLFSVVVPIMTDAQVRMDKGTGAVMVCTFGDVTDVEWWRKHKLPLRQIISKAGRIESPDSGPESWGSQAPEDARRAFSELSGLGIGQARLHVIEMLRRVGATKGEPEPIEHPVKFFEKGDRPLELIPTRQWYVRLLAHRERLLELGDMINWHPPFMRVRYRNWVENLNQDWCISRQRYFGVPFPVWYRLDRDGQPDYGHPILADPASLPVDPLIDSPPGFDESLRGQPGGFVGDPDVQDTWATSALTPQIISGWETAPERHRKLFPMDIRPQSHEIIRTWAFYTITKAWLHHQDIPWRNVVISGWVLDPDRKKMSKSRGNVVTPMHLIENYSADAIRYWAARARAGVDTAFDEKIFTIGHRLVTKLFNAGKFVLGQAAGVETGQLSPSLVTAELDRSFLYRMRELVEEVTRSFEEYDWAGALDATETFFWAEYCDDYLEMVKPRVYDATNEADRLSALATLRLSLSVLLRLFAPTLPTITEELWSIEFATPEPGERSVHTSPWPSVQEFDSVEPPAWPESFSMARTILREIRQKKGQASVRPRWPVEQLVLRVPEGDVKPIRMILDDVCSAASVRKVELSNGTDGPMRIDVHLAAQFVG